MKFPTTYKLSQIVEFLNGVEIIGDPNMIVSGINEIHMVEEGDITFVDHSKYFEKALNSKASIVIINKRVEVPKGKSLLYAEDPFTEYVSLVKRFSPFKSSKKAVSDSASIGKGTIIQPNTFIGNNVTIGKNCIIHANVSIYDNTIIGNNVIVNSNSVIGGEAFYFKRRPDFWEKLEGCGNVLIEDNVEIGSCCTIDRGVSGTTTIGKGTKMDNHIQVGHDTIIGKNCLISSQVGIAGVVILEDNVTLWGQVGVQKDLTIGEGAVVLGQSGVAKSLEGHKEYFGSPCTEARLKMKEIASLKLLPEIVENQKGEKK